MTITADLLEGSVSSLDGVLHNNEMISACCEFNLSRWPSYFRLCLTNLTRAISIRSWKVGFVDCNRGCLGAYALNTEGGCVFPCRLCRLYRGIRRSKYTYWSLLPECDLSEVFKQFWYIFCIIANICFVCLTDPTFQECFLSPFSWYPSSRMVHVYNPLTTLDICSALQHTQYVSCSKRF
jgi:hypothetical protein